MAQQLTFDLPKRAALDRVDFLVSPSNELAVTKLDLWKSWTGGMFVLTGPRASGKSHLAGVWALNASAAILPAEALRNARPDEIAPDRNLVLEDCDRLAGQPDFEAALFHLFNLMKSEGRALLLTGLRAVGHWPINLPDLKSRLLSLETAALLAPDDQLLAGLLVKLFDDRQLRVTPDLVSYLLPRIERSAAAAEAVVEGLDQMALTEKKPISRRLAAQFLDKAGSSPA